MWERGAPWTASEQKHDVEAIVAILERYISPLNARSMVTTSLHERNLSAHNLARGDLCKLSAPLQRRIRLFLTGRECENAVRDIRDFCQKDSPRAAARYVKISSEGDVSAARVEARRLCEELGAKSYTTQKVTTIVSELTRNIVSYAGEGRMEIVPMKFPLLRIVLRAIDEGPGIPHLSDVLSNNYKSKTGLGRGLSGIRRLADRFDISTGLGGTRVVAEVVI